MLKKPWKTTVYQQQRYTYKAYWTNEHYKLTNIWKQFRYIIPNVPHFLKHQFHFITADYKKTLKTALEQRIQRTFGKKVDIKFKNFQRIRGIQGNHPDMRAAAGAIAFSIDNVPPQFILTECTNNAPLQIWFGQYNIQLDGGFFFMPSPIRCKKCTDNHFTNKCPNKKQSKSQLCYQCYNVHMPNQNHIHKKCSNCFGKHGTYHHSCPVHKILQSILQHQHLRFILNHANFTWQNHYHPAFKKLAHPIIPFITKNIKTIFS